MYQDLHIYVDFNWEKYEENSSNYLCEIYRIIQLAYQHKATVYYSEKQVQDFINNCKDRGDDFIQSHANKLAVLLKNAFKKTNHNHVFEICFSDENTSLNYINNTAVSVIKSYSQNALISTENYNYKTLLSIASAMDFEKVDFKVINNANSLLHWIQNNSSRYFNLSTKHGENGRGNQPGQSVLRCSKNEAQQLLNTAIPDFTEKEKQLFNFDENHQTFIEFFYEGDNPQKQWHGFHITNNEWEKRIPVSIRKYFDKV